MVSTNMSSFAPPKVLVPANVVLPPKSSKSLKDSNEEFGKNGKILNKKQPINQI